MNKERPAILTPMTTIVFSSAEAKINETISSLRGKYYTLYPFADNLFKKEMISEKVQSFSFLRGKEIK